jgi:ankyrin repeat protein
VVHFFTSPRIAINVNQPITHLGLTCLHQASCNGNFNLVQFLVAIMKANVECVDHYGRTPLHFACSIGNLAITEFLVQSKANLNALTLVSLPHS